MIKFIDSLIAWLTNPGAKAAELAAAIRSAGSLWSSTETQSKLDEKITSIQAGENVTINWLDPFSPIINAQGTGFGDMEASMYDPTGVQNDAFDRANHHGVMPLSGLSATGTADDTTFLRGDGEWIAPPGGVTSVGMSVPTGFAIAGSPITSSGTLDISYDTGYQGFLTAQATKVNYLTVTGAISLDTVKTKTDYLTVTGAINLDTVKTKTDYLTVTAAVNLDTVKNDATTALKPVDIGISVQAYDVDTAKTDVAQSWSKGQRAAGVTALAISGSTVTWNLADGNYRELSVTANFTLNLPSDIATYPRQSGYILLTNTGSFTMSVAANISVFNSALLPTIAQGSGAKTLLTWCVNAAGTEMLISLGGWGTAL